MIRADSAGMCWGVVRAIDIARGFAKDGQKVVYTDGPLIHNQQMMDKLKVEGIREVGDYHSQSTLAIDPRAADDAVIVVRAHGISPDRRQYLKSIGLAFKDATCPDVGIIAGKIRLHAKKGYATVIFGDPEHPEVIGLLGYTAGRGYVIQSPADIDALPPLGDRVCMVSQSTMFTDEFQALTQHLQQTYPQALIFDTICSATKERQSDIITLMQAGAQAIVVIGGRHSANTKKLVKLAQLQKLPTYHVETIQELDLNAMRQYTVVGVTAGASTPDFLIDEVCNRLEALELVSP